MFSYFMFNGMHFRENWINIQTSLCWTGPSSSKLEQSWMLDSLAIKQIKLSQVVANQLQFIFEMSWQPKSPSTDVTFAEIDFHLSPAELNWAGLSYAIILKKTYKQGIFQKVIYLLIRRYWFMRSENRECGIIQKLALKSSLGRIHRLEPWQSLRTLI